MNKRLTHILVYPVLALLAGCGDFPTPHEIQSELTRPSQREIEIPISPSTQSSLFETTFTNKTGLAFPPSAATLFCTNTHGGWFGDGEFSIIIQLDQQDFKLIAKGEPPWQLPNWRRGPVDGRAGGNCLFGRSGGFTTTVPEDDSLSVFERGPADLLRLYRSTNVLWAARPRGYESNLWHNGDLLILDPATLQLWYSEWDM